MDFREICDFFGGTIFYDDFRGNLKEIQKKLDRLDSESPPEPSIDHTATLILLRAVWNLLSGDFENASVLLGYLTDGEYGPRWRFRGHAYTSLMVTWIEFPPLFKQCELSGPALLTWRGRSPAKRAASEFVSCYKLKEHVLSDLDLVEVRVLHQVNEFYSRTRGVALKLNPAVEGYEDHQNIRDNLQKEVSASEVQLVRLLQRVAEMELLAVGAYLIRLLYEIAHTAGFPDQDVYLELMKEWYTMLGDEAGIGLYWLIRGDYNTSPPFTSPLVLNFDIVDCPDEYGGDSTMFYQVKAYSPQLARQQVMANLSEITEERIGSAHGQSSSFTTVSNEAKRDLISPGLSSNLTHHTRFLKNLSAARACYDEAEIHFRNAGSARGSAAVALRKACTLFMEDIQPYRNWRTAKNYSEIKRLLDISQQLCDVSGDVQLEKLVETHFLLAWRTNDINSAKSLGDWAESSHNSIFGLCLGLLTFRVGQFFRYHCGSMTRATAALEISRHLLKPMKGFRTLWFQVMLAEASSSKSQGNFPGAKIWHDCLKESWQQMVSLLLPSSLLGDCSDPASEIKKSCAAMILLFTARTVESIISVDIQLGDPSAFPSESTRKLLDRINYKNQQPITQQWWSTQQLHIKYQKTIRLHKRLLQRGELEKANESLETFLNDQDILSREDLQARSYIIDVSMTYGADHFARDILSRIKDDDLLPLQYVTVSRGFSAEVKRDERRRSLRSLEVIFLCSIKAGDWARARRLLDSLESASPGFFTSKTSYTQLWPWQRFLYAGLVYEKEQQYNLAMLYFRQSWAFIKVSQMCIGTPNERRLLWDSPDVVRLVASLARRSLMWESDQPGVTKLEPSADPRIDTRMFEGFDMGVDYGEVKHSTDALFFLETGRAQHVWETSILVEGTSYKIVEANYKYRMWIQLKIKDTRTKSEEAEFQQLDKEKKEFTALLYSASPNTSNPRLTAFPLPMKKLFESIPTKAIVLYTSLSDEGMIILAVDRTGIKGYELAAEITPKVLSKLVLSYLQELQAEKESADSDSSKLDALGSKLSRVLFNPSVERYIAASEHVIFVPSGDLMRLPLGALKYKNDYLILQKEVSQVPSLSALCQLRCYRQASVKISVSVIAQPGSIARARATGEPALPMAGIEAKLIGKLAGAKVSDAKDVTRKQFQDDLKNSGFLHISTHGYSDDDFAMNPYISLQEEFRVIDMLAVSTNVQLVTFSACLSGMGHASESGDMQGFPQAILAAGANAFIGALWETNDLATMIHMYYFYFLLFGGVLKDPSFAHAWQGATFLLYHLTVPEAIDWLEIFVGSWDKWDERGEKPNDFVKNGRKKLTGLIQDLKTEEGAKKINFKHPYIWAPFVLVGNGSTIVISSRYEEFSEKLKEVRIRMDELRPQLYILGTARKSSSAHI